MTIGLIHDNGSRRPERRTHPDRLGHAEEGDVALPAEIRALREIVDDLRASVADLAKKVEVLVAEGHGDEQVIDLRLKVLEKELQREDSVTELRLRVLESAIKERDHRAWVEQVAKGTGLFLLGAAGEIARRTLFGG